ncbi:hypothetical protein Pcinc_034296, partial [Petrolisthes cinctipes]
IIENCNKDIKVLRRKEGRICIIILCEGNTSRLI